MPFTFAGTTWTDLNQVEAPGNSTNPVLKLVGTNGTILWVKAAPGGRRVAFAGDVMSRVGFAGTGTRLLDGAERTQALAQMRLRATAPAAAQNVRQRFGELEASLAGGTDLILMENVVGEEYRKTLGPPMTTANAIAAHLAILSTPTIQEDVARLIAADLLLGNFDRIAYNSSDDDPSVKFHSGNFIYEAAQGRFLPIDNDTVAPSLQHIRKVDGADPTKEDLYRTVIEGAFLAVATTQAFPAAEQASMDALLGPNANTAIAACLADGFKASLSAADRTALDGYAAIIAPKVRQKMALLLQELKAPGGGAVGLNALIKAQNNLEGMDYTTFKVKSRFAEFLLDPAAGRSTDQAKDMAVAYGKYRDWKAQLEEYLNNPPNYTIPHAQLVQLGAKEKFKRAANTVAAGVSKVLPANLELVAVDRNLEQIMAEAKSVKKDVRKPGNNANEAMLRQQYAAFSLHADVDNRIIKAKVLLVANLLRIDLLKLNLFLQEILDSAPTDGVGRFYCKAITKRVGRVVALTQAFSTQIEALAPALATLSDKEQAVIGATVLKQLVSDFKYRVTQAKALA